MEFIPFPKLYRIKRQCTITEKIDGTNAQILIKPFDEVIEYDGNSPAVKINNDLRLVMFVGSRTRYIVPGKNTDNAGFAQWCYDNSDELFKLGKGQHFGEWWGGNIQRGYGVEKKFSLFNTERWKTICSDAPNLTAVPGCCSVVPILYQGDFTTNAIDNTLNKLREDGSVAAPGFTNPEGMVIYHHATREMYKVTLDNNDGHKGNT